MDEVDIVFFELIRVAVGNQDCLSRIPSGKEWGELFEIAQKQSLVGICYAGIQRLGANSDDGFEHIGISESLYYQWMGTAAQIQQRNEVVIRQCVVLQKKLAAGGIHSSILKGQGVASLYSGDLQDLRQPGDIDIYVNCGREEAIRYAKSQQKAVKWDYKHLHLNVFPDTEVEVHYRTGIMFNLFRNRLLHKWEMSEDMQRELFAVHRNGMVVPSERFNLVFLLQHMYHHAMSEGCGLRQFMDYYFVLKNVSSKDSKDRAALDITRFGMKKFSSGVMWVLKTVFGMDEDLLLMPSNEKVGQFLLADALRGGNFGKYDHSRHWGTKLYPVKLVCDWFTRDFRILRNVSPEAMWYPVWAVYHFFWKRIWKLRHKELLAN